MKKISLALALVLLPVSIHPSPMSLSNISFPQNQKPASSEMLEARLEQQKSKWAPNGMKVLIIHGKRRWAVQQGSIQVEKSEIHPIQKEGI